MRIIVFLPLVVLVAAGQSRSAPADAAGREFFEAKIRPVLVDHCFACHSAKAKKVRAGLLLDTRDGLRKGGESGSTLVPGQPEASLLMKALRHTDETLHMPPKGKLPDAVIADFEAWIKMGAPDPRDKAAPVLTGLPAATTTWQEMLRTRRQWWSLQPVRKPEVPQVQDAAWSLQPVDRFLLAGLEKAGLKPAGPAERRTLIRRLSLVLTGLPATPAEIESFVRDESPQAYETQVSRLLKSPHFGERWARHWLDVVHFSETHGNEWNYEVHHAWRYRDYLIRALNSDVPYDQLVREHLAGDLLAKPRWNQKDKTNESVIGTAFYRFGEVNHDDCIDLRQIGYDLVDNQIDTLGKAFQATTIACARCHDHKLDAVSMQDYYGLLGVLRSSRQVSHTIDAPEVNADAIGRLRDLKSQIRKELGTVWLKEAGEVGRYLLAASARLGNRSDAAALAKDLDAEKLQRWVSVTKMDKAGLEEPLTIWRRLRSPTLIGAGASGAEAIQAGYRKLADEYAKMDRDSAESNAKGFTTWADFRAANFAGWQAGGQALRDAPGSSGDFVLHADGNALVKVVLPAGCFTHTLSEKLNGTLRSPILPRGTKHVSLQVMGEKSSAVRLVSNNCQLNYRNYRALTNGELHWITFSPPEESDGLRVYAELTTKFDNPKYPDQLGTLGGDSANHRVPWEKAAADPHSFFGVTRVVFHDGAGPPRPELRHLRPLFAAPAPATLAELGQRYARVVASAVRAWQAGRATDADVAWLAGLLRHGLLANRVDLTARLQQLAELYRATEKKLALPRIVPGLADFGPGFEQPIFVRGDWNRPGEKASRRYLEVLSKPGDHFPSMGSGRLQLAERIASPANPLTARVMVNRIWHHLFGLGLVRTVDDFGRVGETPSHPELLDYLAARFVEDGWSMKRMIGTIVLSRAFQMSNRPSPAAREVDPQNRLLHHYPARRMEAEAIRDALLTASGRLNRTLCGPSIAPYRESENADRRLFPGPLDGHGRRSIYIKNILMESPNFLGAFNFPGGKVTQGRRDVTNVPAQSLALLNDPFTWQQAEVWAARLVKQPDAAPAERIDRMFVTALGRLPDKDQRQRFEQGLSRVAALRGVPAEEIMRNPAVWTDLAHALFNLKEFIYIP